MSSSRRDFLKRSATLAGALPAASFMPPLFHSWKPKYPPAIVNVYLRGGADFLNMVIPWKDRVYRSVRPGIAIREEDGPVKLDSRWVLHPALSAFEPLWKAKMLAPVVGAGSPHPTRSHFDAQDFMEYAAPGNRTLKQGWLNRYLTESADKNSNDFRAMATQELLPRSLRGEFPVLAVPTSMDRKKGSKLLDRFEEFYGDGMTKEGGVMGERKDDSTGVVDSGKATIETLRRFQEIVGSKKSRRGDSNYPQRRFGSRLEIIARVLKSGEGLEVAGIDIGGWDDHTNQGGVEGRQADRLRDFATAIAAFCEDMGPRMANTAVVVMTEFGRTVRENGNNGTDHGHGGGMFVIGGGVKGGKVHGSWRGLGDENLYQGRDLQATTDFRDVMAECLDGVFGFRLPKGFFPDYKTRKVGLF